MLRGESAADIVFLRHFPGDQRLEFDAMAQPDNAYDLTGILGTSERGGYPDGYFFGFGSEGNTNMGSKLLRKNREVKRYDARIVRGKLHHVICQREGNALTLIVDGKVIATPSRSRDRVTTWLASTYTALARLTTSGSIQKRPARNRLRRKSRRGPPYSR